MSRGAVALLTAALLLPAPLQAHEQEAVHVHGFAEVGLRRLGDEGYLGLRPGALIEGPRLSVVLAPTFHLGLSADTRRPILRPEDQDELTDWGRILARFEAWDRSGAWAVKAGSLSFERLGHGTLVSDYVTALDPDHPHTGLRAHLAGERVRLEVLAGELLAPQVLAGRLSVSPLGGDGWRVGTTVASDLSAPVRLTGGVAPGRVPAATASPVALLGLDTEVTLWRGEGGAFAPYLDGALVAAGPLQGRGALHAGVLVDLRFTEGTEASLKAEARRLGAGYVPEYFDAYYTLERWLRPEGEPKAAGVDAPTAWGGRVEAALQLAGVGSLAISADGRDVGPANAALHLTATPPWPVTGSLHVAHRGFPGWRGVLLDRGWLAFGEVRAELGEVAWLVVTGGRLLRTHAVTGRPEPVWDLSLAVGAGF